MSLALTRRPFPTGQVYGVDLLGAAFACVAVIAILNVLDGPSTVILAGAVSGLSALVFAALASGLGSLASDRFKLNTQGRLVAWGAVVVATCDHVADAAGDLPGYDGTRTLGAHRSFAGGDHAAGFLLGFAFPTGTRLVEDVDKEPTSWFWGINGAVGGSGVGVGSDPQHGVRHRRDHVDFRGVLSAPDLPPALP